jgi:hypothetical protein
MLAAMFDDGTITFAQKLSGRLTTIGPGLADLELAADDPTPLGPAMQIGLQLSFVTEHQFRARGTVAVAGRDALAIATVDDGHLIETHDRGARHGTAVLDATGLGPLAGLHGRITSNFVVSGDGRVTDRQVLVLLRPQHHNQGGSP